MVSRRGLVRLMGNGYMRYDTKGNHGDGKVHGVRILHSGMDWRFWILHIPVFILEVADRHTL